jgi:hypothetical protein
VEAMSNYLQSKIKPPADKFPHGNVIIPNDPRHASERRQDRSLGDAKHDPAAALRPSQATRRSLRACQARKRPKVWRNRALRAFPATPGGIEH